MKNKSLTFVSVGEDGTPNIRPLETLHNALSLRQVDTFLEQITNANYKTPTLSPNLETPPDLMNVIQETSEQINDNDQDMELEV